MLLFEHRRKADAAARLDYEKKPKPNPFHPFYLVLVFVFVSRFRAVRGGSACVTVIVALP
jgi:hypothetical protein